MWRESTELTNTQRRRTHTHTHTRGNINNRSADRQHSSCDCVELCHVLLAHTGARKTSKEAAQNNASRASAKIVGRPLEPKPITCASCSRGGCRCGPRRFSLLRARTDCSSGGGGGRRKRLQFGRRRRARPCGSRRLAAADSQRRRPVGGGGGGRSARHDSSAEGRHVGPSAESNENQFVRQGFASRLRAAAGDVGGNEQRVMRPQRRRPFGRRPNKRLFLADEGQVNREPRRRRRR